MTNYKLSSDTKGESLILIYEDGDPVTVPGTHPRFSEILDLLRSGNAEDEKIKELVNIMHAAGKKLSAITDRISVAPYGVFFDGDILRTELAEIIGDMLDEGRGDDLTAVAKFLENAAANQSMDAIDAMYRWITNRDMILTSEGTFLAYKGVTKNAKGEVVSITRGTALVDGEEITGNIPNPIGSVITMPRSEVTSDTAVGCGPGLHAGTYSYARSFAGRNAPMLLVEINPRDVVSVPSDSSFQKLRVSRYKVLEHIEDRQDSRYYEFEDVEDDGDFTEEGQVDAQETAEDLTLRSEDAVDEGTDETPDDSASNDSSLGEKGDPEKDGYPGWTASGYQTREEWETENKKTEEEPEKGGLGKKLKKWWTGE